MTQDQDKTKDIILDAKLPRRIRHGQSGTRLDTIFRGMVKRCSNPRCKAFKNYGGRGITICELWLADRSIFFAWAHAAGYRDDLFIDRIDNDAGYSPSNCRWVNRSVNNNNKRNHLLVTHDGETLNVAQWERKLGAKPGVIRARLKKGWPDALAISTPVVPGNKEFAKMKPKGANLGKIGCGLAKLDEDKSQAGQETD